MAVVSISRIQVRRGRANSGTGFPQLASGEFGWAIDTQELYIGNGAVAEGAPAVGNTKILTERDITAQNSFFNLLRYTYKFGPDSNIITGPNENTPISRTLQAVVDEHVTTTAFGMNPESNDNTAALQRAIDQLYLNTPKASVFPNGVSKRVILEIPAGLYKISNTIFVPSFATIIGAGSNKTIIEYTGPGPAFKTVNDTSTPGNPSNISSTLGINQPRNIIIKGITIRSLFNGDDQGLWNANFTYAINDIVRFDNQYYIAVNTNINQNPFNSPNFWSVLNQTALQLDVVKESYFDDISFEGNWGIANTTPSKAIDLNAISNILTTEQNVFNQIKFSNYQIAIYSDQDILNNNFVNCQFKNCDQGALLGDGIQNGSTIVGKLYGPRSTLISNCWFDNIKQHAVYVYFGTGNSITNCKFINVGNNGGDHSNIEFPQVYIRTNGNNTENNQSDRYEVLGEPFYGISKTTLTLSETISAVRGTLIQQTITGASGYLTTDINGLTGTVIRISSNEFSDSSNDLLIINGVNTTIYPTTVSVLSPTGVPYIPVISGKATYKSSGSKSLSVGTETVQTRLFRLPVSVSAIGSPSGSIGFEVDYVYSSVNYHFTRRGKLYIGADCDTGVSPPREGLVQLSDDYDYIGTDSSLSLNLKFYAKLLDKDGNEVLGNEQPFSICIFYTNINDSGNLTYSYTATM